MLRALQARYRNQSAVLLCTDEKEIIYECEDEYWGIGKCRHGELSQIILI